MPKGNKMQDIRQSIIEKVKEARAHKEAMPVGCEHSWGLFKETAKRDNPSFKGNGAYFITKGCAKCHKKIRTDYRVER